jgi:hypothetical protein
VRPADLDDPGEGLRLLVQGVPQDLQRRQQLLDDG